DPSAGSIAIGAGKVLERGDDILILAIGRTVHEALAAHPVLLEQGISATIVDCRFVKPIDAESIAFLAQKIPRVITIEENVRLGGFGSAVVEVLCDEGINDFVVERMGIPDIFVEHGPQQLLRSKYAVDAAAIVKTAVKLTRPGFNKPCVRSRQDALCYLPCAGKRAEPGPLGIQKKSARTLEKRIGGHSDTRRADA
ncbi:MAG: transketolase C-terminal domain-containing protein, partial [Desulfobacterales bacterium]